MNKQDYIEVRNQAGKDALKAMAFFFILLPVLFGVFVALAI